MFSKISAIVLFAIAFAYPAAAQSSGAFRAGLAEPDPVSGAAVAITENGRAAAIMERYDTEHVKGQAVPGYRVRVFFANNQNARNDAIAVQEKFRTQFPDIPTYLVYETPSFLVTVGNCMTTEEALILLGRVSKRYPTAFLWRGDIPITEFLKGGDETAKPENAEETAPETLF